MISVHLRKNSSLLGFTLWYLGYVSTVFYVLQYLLNQVYLCLINLGTLQQLSFNSARYLLEIMNSIKSVSLSIHLNTPKSPTSSQESQEMTISTRRENLGIKGNPALASEVLDEARSLQRMHRRLFSSESTRPKVNDPIVLPSIIQTKPLKLQLPSPSLSLEISEALLSRPTTSGLGTPATAKAQFMKQSSKAESLSDINADFPIFELERPLRLYSKGRNRIEPIARTRIYMLEDIYRRPRFKDSCTDHKAFYSQPPPPIKLNYGPLKYIPEFSGNRKPVARLTKQRT